MTRDPPLIVIPSPLGPPGGARYCERVATVFARRQAPSGGAAPEASPATDCEALALPAPTTDDDAMAVSRPGVCALAVGRARCRLACWAPA